MPGMNRGSTPILKRYRGATPLTKRYRGSVLTWSSARIRDDFYRPDSPDIGPDWGNLDPEHPPLQEWTAGVHAQTVRFAIPDNQIGTEELISRRLYLPEVMDQEDHYVECRVATVGDGNNPAGQQFHSQLFGWCDAAMIQGVGIDVWTGNLNIVSRYDSIDTRIVDCGAYVAGDFLRLTTKGNLHTMTRNGRFVGEWDDLGWQPRGPLNVWMGLAVSATKDFLGPRRFSPAFDYVEMGPA